MVTPMVKTTALNVGSGGQATNFHLSDGKLFEHMSTNNISAYMLIYIRQSELNSIMNEIQIEDIHP
jgi:hypothetical protein